MSRRASASTSAGIAAACGGDWDAAEQHYQTALRQAHEIPRKIAQPEARRWYAQMLLDRNAPGDRDRARTLLGEAIEMYGTIGMPKPNGCVNGSNPAVTCVDTPPRAWQARRPALPLSTQVNTSRACTARKCTNVSTSPRKPGLGAAERRRNNLCLAAKRP